MVTKKIKQKSRKKRKVIRKKINRFGNKHSALIRAILKPDMRQVSLLVNDGAIIGEYDILRAIYDSNLDIINYLIKKTDSNVSNQMMVVAAGRGIPLSQGDTSVLKYLISNGGVITESVLKSAAAYGHYDTVKYLIDNGAVVSDDVIYHTLGEYEDNGWQGGFSFTKVLVHFIQSRGQQVIDIMSTYDNIHPEVLPYLQSSLQYHRYNIRTRGTSSAQRASMREVQSRFNLPTDTSWDSITRYM
jgi:hypothetical protein